MWLILNLIKILTFSTDFKQIFAINHKIALLGHQYFGDIAQLIVEERFTKSSLVNMCTQAKHQIRIVKVDLVRFVQTIKIYDLARSKQEQFLPVSMDRAALCADRL